MDIMGKIVWIKRAAIALIIILAFLLPFMVRSYYLHIAVLSLLNALLALGLNCIAGYAGQLSLAQAAFFGIGSYTTALCMLNLGLSFWLAAPLGIALAVVVAVGFGLPTLRLKGPYFVISTLGFGEIVRLLFLNWESVTRGPNGLPGIPAPDPIFFIMRDAVSWQLVLMPVLAGSIVLVLFFVVFHRWVTREPYPQHWY